MIGAMPAVAVRHERRRQEKRTKRPTQLYLGGAWMPPHSPSPSPSPQVDVDDRLPEYYMCGKVSALHAVVCSLLLGAIVLVVGLVQLSPGAEAADHRYYLMAAGGALLVLGLVLTAVRCCCLQCAHRAPPMLPEAPPEGHGVSSIEGLVASEHHVRPTTGASASELDALLRKAGVTDNSSSDT